MINFVANFSFADILCAWNILICIIGLTYVCRDNFYVGKFLDNPIPPVNHSVLINSTFVGMSESNESSSFAVLRSC